MAAYDTFMVHQDETLDDRVALGAPYALPADGVLWLAWTQYLANGQRSEERAVTVGSVNVRVGGSGNNHGSIAGVGFIHNADQKVYAINNLRLVGRVMELPA